MIDKSDNPSAANVIGFLDRCDRQVIAGWVYARDAPTQALTLQIHCNNELIGEAVADRYRSDLVIPGIHDGHCAFNWHWPTSPPDDACRITLRIGTHIFGTPRDLPAKPSITMRGTIDLVDRTQLAGWAYDPSLPDTPLTLHLQINGIADRTLIANAFRADLRDAGMGDGRHGFHVAFNPALDPTREHEIIVRHGPIRLGFPITVPRSTRFDADLQSYLSGLVAGLEKPQDLQIATSFFDAQRARLREKHDEMLVHTQRRVSERLAKRRHDSGDMSPSIALVIDDQAPDTTRDAGSVALSSHMSALVTLGFTVMFMASRRAPSHAEATALKRAGINSLDPSAFENVESALQRLGPGLEVVYLHRLGNAGRYSDLVRLHAPSATLVWSIADLASLRLRRQAQIESRPEVLHVAERMAIRENMQAWCADVVVTHSPVEATLLRRLVPSAHVTVVPWHVPTRRRRVKDAEGAVIAFVAHYGHAPNLDAAKWLVRDIMPHLRQLHPGLRCRLIGSAANDAIHRLRADDIEIVGHVANLGHSLADVQLCVAPLRFGAGIKGKVLEAWSYGLPIMMTDIAAEGILADDDPMRADSIADDPALFAQRAVRLLCPIAARAHVTAGRRLLRTRYNAVAICNAFADVLPSIDTNPGGD